MHKYLLKKKLAGLLAFSLLFSSVPAWAAEDTSTTSTEVSVPSYYELNFDVKSYTPQTLYLKGMPINFRAYEGCHYTAYPVAAYKEQLNIYIPEAYFQKKSINGYTAKTAPIFLPLSSDEAKDGTFATPADASSAASQPNIAFLALAHGYVVAVPAAQSLTPPANERLGKAPQAIISYKAAIRYLRRNQSSLPAGNINRIIVSGQGLSGSLALQLAASANQDIYQPFLRAVGAAGRSDSVFAAQAYEPVPGLEKDFSRFGWTLPDGRPDPNTFSCYAPLLDTKASLTLTDTPAPKAAEISEEDIIEAAAEDTQENSLPDKDKNSVPAQTKASAGDSQKPSVTIIYDTPEYQDYLARQAEYEQIGTETQELIRKYSPKSQAAPYLRLCASSEAPHAQELQNLQEAFEESGTKVTSLDQAASPLQDAEELFAWIDAANIEQNTTDEQLAKLWQKQRAKLARAKLLAERAALKAQKKQAMLEEQARLTGQQLAYPVAKTKKN